MTISKAINPFFGWIDDMKAGHRLHFLRAAHAMFFLKVLFLLALLASSFTRPSYGGVTQYTDTEKGRASTFLKSWSSTHMYNALRSPDIRKITTQGARFSQCVYDFICCADMPVAEGVLDARTKREAVEAVHQYTRDTLSQLNLAVQFLQDDTSHNAQEDAVKQLMPNLAYFLLNHVRSGQEIKWLDDSIWRRDTIPKTVVEAIANALDQGGGCFYKAGMQTFLNYPTYVKDPAGAYEDLAHAPEAVAFNASVTHGVAQKVVTHHYKEPHKPRKKLKSWGKEVLHDTPTLLWLAKPASPLMAHKLLWDLTRNISQKRTIERCHVQAGAQGGDAISEGVFEGLRHDVQNYLTLAHGGSLTVTILTLRRVTYHCAKDIMGLGDLPEMTYAKT